MFSSISKIYRSNLSLKTVFSIISNSKTSLFCAILIGSILPLVLLVINGTSSSYVAKAQLFSNNLPAPRCDVIFLRDSLRSQSTDIANKLGTDGIYVKDVGNSVYIYITEIKLISESLVESTINNFLSTTLSKYSSNTQIALDNLLEDNNKDLSLITAIRNHLEQVIERGYYNENGITPMQAYNQLQTSNAIIEKINAKSRRLKKELPNRSFTIEVQKKYRYYEMPFYMLIVMSMFVFFTIAFSFHIIRFLLKSPE